MSLSFFSWPQAFTYCFGAYLIMGRIIRGMIVAELVRRDNNRLQ